MHNYFFASWHVKHPHSVLNVEREWKYESCRELCAHSIIAQLYRPVYRTIVNLDSLGEVNVSPTREVFNKLLEQQKDAFQVQVDIGFKKYEWTKITSSIKNEIITELSRLYTITVEPLVGKIIVVDGFTSHEVAGISLFGDLRVLPAFYWTVKLLYCSLQDNSINSLSMLMSRLPDDYRCAWDLLSEGAENSAPFMVAHNIGPINSLSWTGDRREKMRQRLRMLPKSVKAVENNTFLSYMEAC